MKIQALHLSACEVIGAYQQPASMETCWNSLVAFKWTKLFLFVKDQYLVLNEMKLISKKGRHKQFMVILISHTHTHTRWNQRVFEMLQVSTRRPSVLLAGDGCVAMETPVEQGFYKPFSFPAITWDLFYNTESKHFFPLWRGGSKSVRGSGEQ